MPECESEDVCCVIHLQLQELAKIIWKFHLLFKKNKTIKKLKNSSNKDIIDFLPFDELVDIAGYDEDEAKLKLLDILSFSRSLHDFLRDYGKLSEQQKPLSICGILIALKNDNFRNNYRKLNSKKIPKFWYDSLKQEINRANIPNVEKKEIILNSFLSIRYNPAFISQPLEDSSPS